MSANNLLIWMSARMEGSWSQFRSAVEELHVEEGVGNGDEPGEDAMSSDLPLYQAARLGLERLAHVEFISGANNQRWRVVPPTLAISHSGGQYLGILCGARTPSLYTSLLQLAGSVSVDTHQVPGMPDRIRLVSASAEMLDRVGHYLSLHLQRNAPAMLLAATPPVDDPRTRFPSDPPSTPGWTIHQFSTRNIRWEGSDLQSILNASFGLFRFQLGYQRFHFLRWLGRTFQVPVQVGKYAVLRRRRSLRVVRYERRRAVLSVPLTCRPPLLIERALVLCSGGLPRANGGSGLLEYSEVTPEIARMAGALLCQEINIT